jgi:hypothetical protein
MELKIRIIETQLGKAQILSISLVELQPDTFSITKPARTYPVSE